MPLQFVEDFFYKENILYIKNILNRKKHLPYKEDFSLRMNPYLYRKSLPYILKFPL